jgi:S1-C subfamily serine protease
MRGNFELLDCTVVEEDSRHDLSLLKLSPNPFATGKASGISRTPDGGMGINGLFGLAPLTMERPRDGAAVAVSGYPMSAPTLITTSGAIASAWSTDSAEMVPPGAPAGFTVPDIADSYIADVAVNPGNSGGPTYLVASGAVIGMCVAFGIAEAVSTGGTPLRYNSGLSFVVPIRYGVALLGRHVDLGPGMG